MKLFVCLLALSVVSATICAPTVEKVEKSKITKRGAGYGGSSYGSQTSFIEVTPAPLPLPLPLPTPPAPVFRELIQKPVIQMDTYSAPAPQPLFRDNSVITTTTQVIRELEPEYQNLCLEKKALESVVYLPHPVKQSWFIQCDEQGKGFLHECPAGTIFTLNLVCENINDLHVVEEKRTIVQKPQLDTSYGSYNVAPTFAADATTSYETTRVEVIQESPEFQELCLSKRSRDAYGSSISVFYVAHPSAQDKYIQCDDHGRAFLKLCPAGTIFTLNLACEKIGELHSIEQTVMRPQLDLTSSYSAAPATNSYSSSSYSATPALSMDTTTTTFVDAGLPANPEWSSLCLSKRSYGVGVFYIAYPSSQEKYIQCDEFGNAWVKNCAVGTIFTLNLVCEKIDDLHPIGEQITTRTVERPMLDTTYGSYNVAPVFAQNNAVVETVVQKPILREQIISQPMLSYGERHIERPAPLPVAPVMTRIERPILRESISSYSAPAQVMTRIERPVLREKIVSSYSAPAPRPILREQPVVSSYSAPAPRPMFREQTVVSSYSAPRPILTRPVLRTQPVVSSYSAPRPILTRPILREQPVVSSYSAPRPILREKIVSSYSAPAPRPILREQPVVSSYGAVTRPVMRDQVRPVMTSSYASAY